MHEILVGRDESDLAKFGNKAMGLYAKQLVGKKDEAHLTIPVKVDLASPHVVGLFGKRGQGKCMLPGTPVLLSDGSMAPIEGLFSRAKASGSVVESSDIEELVSCEAVRVMSLSSDLRTRPARISHAYRRKISEQVYRVKTMTGREVVVTAEHPLLTIEGGRVVWKDSSEFRRGEYIAVSRQYSTRSRIQKLRTSSRTVEIMLKSNIFWDKIKSIEAIHYEGWVYDLTVPSTHNFIAGDGGVVCHNSYSMGNLAEEFCLLPEDVKKNLSMIMVDTMGIFWSMKQPNEKDVELLDMWGLKPRGFDVNVCVPSGLTRLYTKDGVPFDSTFSFKVSDLDIMDWLLTFGLSLDSEMGIMLSRALKRVKERMAEYEIKDIMEELEKEEMGKTAKYGLVARFSVAEDWGIFEKEGTPVFDLCRPGRLTVLDVSHFGLASGEWSVKALVIGLLCRRILEERIKARRVEELEVMEGETGEGHMPIVWMLIDEAHQFLPREGMTAAAGPLLQWIKIGREPGVSVLFATQMPNKLHQEAISQCDLVISHRLTSSKDLDSLKEIMASYMRYGIEEYFDNLPRLKGAAIILDDNSEKIFPVRVRPRMSWHAGGSPIAIKK